MRSPERPSLSITLPKKVYDWVDEFASTSGKSRSQAIAAILMQELSRKSNADPFARVLEFSASTADCLFAQVINLSLSGRDKLAIPNLKEPEQECSYLRENYPKLFKCLEEVARSTIADPLSMQPMDERLWPFPVEELQALRRVYRCLWTEIHDQAEPV